MDDGVDLTNYSGETNQLQQKKQTAGEKIGSFVLKIFKPLKENWGKITAIGAAIIAAGYAFGEWALHNFSFEYLNQFIEAVKSFFGLI